MIFEKFVQGFFTAYLLIEVRLSFAVSWKQVAFFHHLNFLKDYWLHLISFDEDADSIYWKLILLQ